MVGVRKQHGKEFKLKVVLEALRGERTLSQVASAHGVHPTQIKTWKEQFLEAGADRLGSRRRKKGEDRPEAALFEEIGRLKVELDFLAGRLKR
jgi:transposase-like protein